MTPEAIKVMGAAATLYGLGGALSVLLQARRMRARGTSGDVSVRFFAVYVGGFAIWLLYGIGIGDVPIIVVHAVGLLCGAVTLAVALRLRRPDAGPAATATTARSAGEDRGRVRLGRTHQAWRARRRNDERPEPNTTSAKEVREMRESCYCGRTGEIEDRDPVATGDGEWALGCPDCGHLDRLDWLPEEARRHAFEEAERRQPTTA